MLRTRDLISLAGSLGLLVACGGGDDGGGGGDDGGGGDLDAAPAACTERRVTFDASMVQHAWDDGIAAVFDGDRLAVATARGANTDYLIEVTVLDAAGQRWRAQAGAAAYPDSGETPPHLALAQGGDKLAVAWNQVRRDDSTPRLTQVAVAEFASDGTPLRPASVQTRATYGLNSVEANAPRLGYLRGADQFALGWSEMRVEPGDTYFTYNAFAKVLGGTETRLVENPNPAGDVGLLMAQVEAFGVDGDEAFAVTYSSAPSATYAAFAISPQGAGPGAEIYTGTGGHISSTAKVGEAIGFVKFSGLNGEAVVSVGGTPRLVNLDDTPIAAAVVATGTSFVFALQPRGDFPFQVVEVSPDGELGRTRFTGPTVTRSSILHASLDGNALHLVWLRDDLGLWTVTGETVCLEP